MKRCPFCDREHHTDRNVTGDVILCACGARLLVQHTQLGTVLIVAGYPLTAASWPAWPEETDGDDTA